MKKYILLLISLSLVTFSLQAQQVTINITTPSYYINNGNTDSFVCQIREKVSSSLTIDYYNITANDLKRPNLVKFNEYKFVMDVSGNKTFSTISNLKVTGIINYFDLRILDEDFPRIKKLDLSEAKLVDVVNPATGIGTPGLIGDILGNIDYLILPKCVDSIGTMNNIKKLEISCNTKYFVVFPLRNVDTLVYNSTNPNIDCSNQSGFIFPYFKDDDSAKTVLIVPQALVKEFKASIIWMKFKIIGDEETESQEIKNTCSNIYPNPATTYFTVNTNDKAVVSIFSINSTLIQETLLNPRETISTTGLIEGVYIVKVQTSNNISFQQLVIK